MSILRVGSYNIRHGQGLDDRLDLERTAAVLRRLDCDLVSVQEVDVGCCRSGGVDQAAELGRLTGMTALFAPAIAFQGGLYGHAVLSRLPVSSWLAMPLPGQEPRCVVAVDVSWCGRAVRFCGTHLDLDAEQRQRSLPILQDLAERAGLPFVLAGDFNSTPESVILNTLVTSWQSLDSLDGPPTYPADAPRQRIDTILAGPAGQWQMLAMEVIVESIASDHRPVRAQLALVDGAQQKG